MIDAERKAKQIMIIFSDHKVALLNPDELANKANDILDKITDSNRPKAVKVELTTKLLSGGLLLHFNSKEAAKWFRQPVTKLVFLPQFAKHAYIKEKAHNVLLRGVPIIFDPANETQLC